MRQKCPATGLDASLSFLSTSRRCSRSWSPSRIPVSPMYNFLQKVQVMQYMVLAEGQVISPAILMDFLRMKRKVLHCERAHLKVPGWLLVWNELLTKKLPMFYSRLNEISGCCEKIVPVYNSRSKISLLDRGQGVVFTAFITSMLRRIVKRKVMLLMMMVIM